MPRYKFLLRLLFFTFILTRQGLAQTPVEQLKRLAHNSPIEKVYLHIDRENYTVGQIIWLKAYLSSNFLPSDKSTVLFVELVNAQSTVISKLNLPVFRAVSQGQFELSDTLTTGAYSLRAYTTGMMNNNPDFIYQKTVFISGAGDKKGSIVPVASAKDSIRLQFFPEGGNFIAGLPNTLAFKATTPNGLPVQVKGVLKNARHEIITEFASMHDGMGMIDIDANAGEGHYVELDQNPGQNYSLPVQAKEGIVFRLLSSTNSIQFEIFQKKDDRLFEAAYLLGQMQHQPVFYQSLQQNVTTISGLINTAKLPSGILQITVFNKAGLPLAERLCFIKNQEYLLSANLHTDTLNFVPATKNHFSVELKDSIAGSFSISVTDPDYSLHPIRTNNILSTLLLTSDLKGYVHNPAYYFSSDNESARQALDLLMMTQGWRRFRWEQLMKNVLPEKQYKEPVFVTLSGRITLKGTKKPFANQNLLLYIVAADSSRSMQLISTDDKGYYKADSLILFGKTTVLFSDIKGKRSKFLDIYPDKDSLNHIVYSKKSGELIVFSSIPDKKNDILQQKLEEEYKAQIQSRGNILSEVVVKTRIKSQQEIMDEKYTSGLFSTEARHTIDLENSNDAINYPNIFDFLESRVPGLKVVPPNYESPQSDMDPYTGESGPRYFLFYRQNPSASSMGPMPMTVYLDEVQTSTAVIATIPAARVAMVKVFPSFAAATGAGAGGVLSIYTKKDRELFPSAGEVLTFNGFSIIKEFYSPDYSLPVSKTNSDQRITLFWKPDVFINGKNIVIPFSFYNNDRTSSFKIVIEGMTTDGKMLMMERMVNK